MMRIRITYSKLEALKYTGNLDMQRVWERILIRSGVPIAYSQGFHPQAKIQQACPLPLGTTSAVEVVDIWLQTECDLDVLIQAIQNALPPGINLKQAAQVDEHSPAMQTRIQSAEYLVRFMDRIDFDIRDSVRSLLASDTLPRERRTKRYDLRPLIEELSVSDSETETVELQMRLSAREGATGRPDEVLAALGLDPSLAYIHRSGLLITPSPDPA